MQLLASPEAKVAFDLSREDERTRDRYGRNAWGQQLLMARRLPGRRGGGDDEHVRSSLWLRQQLGRSRVNHPIFDALRFRAHAYDMAVSALIEDVHQRGLADRVLVVVTGEFGRTPKVEYSPSTGAGNASAPAGTKQPGRDHWPRASSNIWAGGGITPGRVIGATDSRGSDVVERRCSAHDFPATIYRHLGIDGSHVTIQDFNGRPTPIVDHGRPIPELTPPGAG